VKNILNKKSLALAVSFLGIAAALACFLLVRRAEHRNDQAMTSSCANHAIQLMSLVRLFIAEHERFPPDTDARTAASEMNDAGGWPMDWPSSYFSSCPESFLRDKSLGYVYVASGLPTKAAVEQSALVFFCPADSHQRSEQHCHAVMANGLRCLKSNAEMIRLLRQELSRASAGSVPYSTHAQALMQRELAARVKYDRKRGPPPSPQGSGIQIHVP